MEVMPQLEKRTHYLATFANIATLLGLLGTIIGLIRAFTAVSGANPAEKADLLSASISVAMNTTAFGLIVAIPLLLMHAVLQTKTTEAKPASRQVDKLELGSTVIKGNAELPKVLYIVPWQSAGPGNLDGRAMNSLLDQVLAPVDRDVFLRLVDYYGQLSTSPVTDGATN